MSNIHPVNFLRTIKEKRRNIMNLYNRHILVMEGNTISIKV